MIAAIGQWSHGLAALLFALLALWQLSRVERRAAMAILAIAFAVTALWAGIAAGLGPGSALAALGETGRNLAYLTFIFVLLNRGLGDDRRPFVGLVYVALFAVVMLQALANGVLGILAPSPAIEAMAYEATVVIDLCFAIGALLLVNALYSAAASETRQGIRYAVIGITAMWAYDLNLYTFAWLGGQMSEELLALRGVLMTALVPTFFLATRRSDAVKMRLSRKVTFRSLSILAILGYFLIMYLASRAISSFASDYTALIEIGLVFLMSVGAIVLLPSKRVRGWLKVKLAKHLFEHRYDYRAAWIGFNETLARPGNDDEPLDQRVVRAMAEISEATGGLLLVATPDNRLQPGASWSWELGGSAESTPDRALGEWLQEGGAIVAIDAQRADDMQSADRYDAPLPAWILNEETAWALAPLIHREKLVGAVLLKRPAADRPLDWEDFDLLRIAGRQAASHLSEARSQDALAEARRFDEFNRRFAFILHDIKNLVSQLSLVARNAERHADNPEFRADMVATLKASVDKMNDMLARLAPKDRTAPADPSPTDLRQLAQQIAARLGTGHPIEIAAGEAVMAMADAGRLDAALTHIVQNGCDASPDDAPVWLDIGGNDEEAWIAVEDSGRGMDETFVRDQLFRPFSSSKPGGFGIGAFEARALVAEMGGRLDVDSRPGEGSRFTITLPIAPPSRQPASERKVA